MAHNHSPNPFQPPYTQRGSTLTHFECLTKELFRFIVPAQNDNFDLVA